jgi:hypothetical protein
MTCVSVLIKQGIVGTALIIIYRHTKMDTKHTFTPTTI